ncbi:MAG: amino acid permease [Pseudomonadota bacterium]
MADPENPRSFGSRAALAVVIANMIGTGVFTSLGFQLLDIQSGFAILVLWGLGGLAALCGALCYGELGAALPRSGGEYNFLGQVYHPAAGFISGWISATVGFAAPVALVAVTFAAYLSAALPGIPKTPVAVALIVALALAHSRSHEASGAVQWWATAVKLGLIALFCLATLLLVEAPQPINFLPRTGDWELVLSAPFAVSLIYVNYAYTGWNAATYVTGELRDPQRVLPLILIIGTSVVAAVYLALNSAFLHAAPVDALAGKIEIGYIAAEYVFGGIGAKLMAVVLAALLISTVSAMTLAGPRVLQMLGQDYAVLGWLARENRNGIPAMAVFTQSTLAVLLVITSTFESILVFTGFILGLNTLVTVLGVAVLRLRQPDLPRPFRVPWYPLPMLIYSAITLWTLVHIALNKQVEALVALAILGAGGLLYLLTPRSSPSTHP